jgi:cholesterol transport system auxiliary component
MAIFIALAVLSGCGGGKATSDTFALSSAREVEGPSAKGKQILIPEPTALKALDSEQIVIRVASAEIQYLGKARWSDRLPKMVQSKLVEAFENSGKLGGVGRPGEGLAIDYQVVGDIRAFEIQQSGGSHAHVEISVKILNDRNGTVRAQRVFSADVPVRGSDNPSFVAGLDAAFSRVTTDIVGWTLKSI